MLSNCVWHSGTGVSPWPLGALNLPLAVLPGQLSPQPGATLPYGYICFLQGNLRTQSEGKFLG